MSAGDSRSTSDARSSVASTERLLTEILATLKRMEALQRIQLDAEDIDVGMRCPACQSTDLSDASTMGDERYLCGGCGASMTKEMVNG